MKAGRTFASVLALLFFSIPVIAQSRLNDLADRLANEAASLAEATYNDYRGSSRRGRSDIDSVMAAYQFDASAQLFRRLIQDRRRDSELRDGLAALRDLSNQTRRYNWNRSRWSTVQGLLNDLSREIGSTSGYPDYDDTPVGRLGGRATWRGRVDHDVQLVVRGSRVDVSTLSGTPYYDGTFSFTQPLPARRVNASVIVRKGRGEVTIEQQPSRANEFAIVIHIRDPKGGAGDYELEVNW
jgi:hypothetical protein